MLRDRLEVQAEAGLVVAVEGRCGLELAVVEVEQVIGLGDGRDHDRGRDAAVRLGGSLLGVLVPARLAAADHREVGGQVADDRVDAALGQVGLHVEHELVVGADHDLGTDATLQLQGDRQRPVRRGFDHPVGADLEAGQAGLERRLADDGRVVLELECDSDGLPPGGGVGGADRRLDRRLSRHRLNRRAWCGVTLLACAAGDRDGNVGGVDGREPVGAGDGARDRVVKRVKKLDSGRPLVDCQVVELVTEAGGQVGEGAGDAGAGVEVGADERGRDRRQRRRVKIARSGAVHRGLERSGETVESLGQELDLHRVGGGLVGARATGGVRGVGGVADHAAFADGQLGNRCTVRVAEVEPLGLELLGGGVVVGEDLDPEGGRAASTADGQLADPGGQRVRVELAAGTVDRGPGVGACRVGDDRTCGGPVDVDGQRGGRHHAHRDGLLNGVRVRGLLGGAARDLTAAALHCVVEAQRCGQERVGRGMGHQRDAERVAVEAVGESRVVVRARAARLDEGAYGPGELLGTGDRDRGRAHLVLGG